MKLLNKTILRLLLIFCVGLSSCSKDEDALESTLKIEKISGDNQQGMPEGFLPEPVKVRLLDHKGAPAMGVTVLFTAAEGGGKPDTNRVTTNHEGYAQTTWQLGKKGNQRLHVTVLKPNGIVSVTNSPLFFSAGFETLTVQKVSGDNQNGFPDILLQQPVRIRVINSKGEPEPNLAVTFTLSDPGGIVVDATPKTDQDGYAQAKWQLGNQPSQVLEVALTSISGVVAEGTPVRFTATINYTVVAGGNGPGSGSEQLNYPGNIFVDAAGAVYIADDGNHRVQKWLPGATEGVTVAGGNGLGSNANQLWSPNTVVVDQAGNVYVNDHGNFRIQKWAPGATEGVTVVSSIHVAGGFALDAAGNIYLIDDYGAHIEKWAPGAASGVIVAGGNGTGSAQNQFSSPNAVFADQAGNIYVSDRYNHRVQKWAPGATSGITVAGGNGQGAAANQLIQPISVYADANGNVYVSDAGNSRIQKWAPGATEGVTVAGGTVGRAVADQNGNVYLSESVKHRVTKWAP